MRTIIALIATAFMLSSTGSALAGGGYGHHGYRSHGHGHHYRGHGHGHGGYYLLGGLIGGLILADAFSRPRYHTAPAYVTAPTRARYDCKPTTGTGYRNGRLATFGGTFCYDAGGVGYVVPGSEYLIGYQQ